MGERIGRSQSPPPRISPSPEPEITTAPQPNLNRPLPPIPTKTETKFTTVSKPQTESGETLLDRTSEQSKTERAPRREWQLGQTDGTRRTRTPIMPRELQAPLGQMDLQIKGVGDQLQTLRQQTPTPESLTQKLQEIRELESANATEKTSIDQLRENLPKIGGGDKKKSLNMRESQLERMVEIAQQMRTERQTGLNQVQTLTRQEGEFTRLQLDGDFLREMSGKLQQRQAPTSHELHRLGTIVENEKPGRESMRGVAQTLLSKMEQLPALSGLNTLPEGVFRGAGQGTKLGENSLMESAKNLTLGNPDLNWSVTTRSESDIKRQIESNLPQLTGEPLSPQHKARVVDTIYRGLLEGCNSASQDLQTVKLNGVEYHRVRDLGVGGGGTVALYEDNNHNQVAMKILHPTTDSESRGRVLQELDGHRRAMGGGPHPNLTDLKGVVRVNDQQMLVAMESVPGGDLQKLTDRIQRGGLTDQQKLHVNQFMMKGAVEGLKHVHDQGMVHLDIKPDNFLLNPQTMQTKLSDFGLSRIGTSIQTNISEGTDRYMSPQQLSPSYKEIGQVSQKDDVWSLGVMLHEMVEGRNPFNQGLGAGDQTLAFGRDPNNRVFPNDGGRPERQLINQMMNPDPQQRPTLEQVLQHPFFTQNLGTDDGARQLLQGLPQ